MRPRPGSPARRNARAPGEQLELVVDRGDDEINRFELADGGDFVEVVGRARQRNQVRPVRDVHRRRQRVDVADDDAAAARRAQRGLKGLHERHASRRRRDENVTRHGAPAIPSPRSSQLKALPAVIARLARLPTTRSIALAGMPSAGRSATTSVAITHSPATRLRRAYRPRRLAVTFAASAGRQRFRPSPIARRARTAAAIASRSWSGVDDTGASIASLAASAIR